MIEVLCDRRSKTAERLQEALAVQAPQLEGLINWTGAPNTEATLNARSRTNKLAQLTCLELRGVAVPPWDLQGHGPDWYPRTLNHQQGRDFTAPIGVGEIGYYVKRLELLEEWRLHFFRTRKGNVKLLRSGIKIPRVRNPHPWVRSHRLGWKISYTGGCNPDLVDEARKAVQVLDLDFAAVDVAFGVVPGVRVLEVNTCPGLEAGTLQRYVDAIKERLA